MSKADKFVLICLVLSFIFSTFALWNTHQANEKMKRAYRNMERAGIHYSEGELERR